MKRCIIVLLTLYISYAGCAQDTLPKFTAKVLNNTKSQISWTNNFGATCTQISVQKSYDSTRFFQTIFSSLSPELPQNGFVDNEYMSQLKIYYRIFYVLNDGRYFFTQSKTAKKIVETAIINDSSIIKSINVISGIDSVANNTASLDSANKTTIDFKLFDIKINKPKIEEKKIYTIYKRKTTHLAYVIDEVKFSKFKDSIINNTKDTLLEMEGEIIIWNPYTPPPAWKPSLNIFSNSKGSIELLFKEYKTRKYRVVFFDYNNKEIFRIKQINNSKLILDKSNFIKAGWYYFELYENEKLIEKNKFLVESDF